MRTGAQPGPPLLFLHIPKTGGTTLRKHLEHVMGRHAVRGVYGPAAVRAFTTEPLPAPPVRAVFTHGRIGCLLAHPEAPRGTMLRHPVDRLLSQYRMARTWPDHQLHRAALQMTPVEFAHARLADDHAEGQSWVLSQSEVGEDRAARPASVLLGEAQANLDTMSFVGLAERFDESLALLSLDLGVRPSPYARRNTSIDRAGDALSERDRQAIAEVHPADMELYRQATDHFARRWEAAGAEATKALAAVRGRAVRATLMASASDLRQRARRAVRQLKARRG